MNRNIIFVDASSIMMDRAITTNSKISMVSEMKKFERSLVR